MGPILWSPLSQVCGRSSVIFWSLLGVLVFNVWGASMTRSDQFVPFILSRMFAGLCGAVPTVYGARLIIDIFFIHERGRAFSIFHVSFILGVIALPTLGAFTAAHVAWPNMFWWTVGLLGSAIILVLLFVEETGYERSNENSIPNRAYPTKLDSFVANRIVTFFPGNQVVPETTLSKIVSHLKSSCGDSSLTSCIGMDNTAPNHHRYHTACSGRRPFHHGQLRFQRYASNSPERLHRVAQDRRRLRLHSSRKCIL